MPAKAKPAIRAFFDEPTNTVSYLVWDAATMDGAVIDPVLDYDFRSGKATFASDGEVKANIMGSGDVTVRGRARCKVHTMGSGSLVCEGGSEEVDKAA